ncbi:MAG TPA: helix-turn-helix transcriptional regulator [Candidatus Paceibacterota bacterium]|nr:helix-turn-helix transcriptional regulator [Candidatus Paceibacterota bacterium]
MASTQLAPVDGRAVVRCELVQFQTLSGACRKCRTSLIETELTSEPEETRERANPDQSFAQAALLRKVLAMPEGPNRLRFGLAYVLREIRIWHGLSQAEVAKRLSCPRTWLSKIERGECSPLLGSLERLAAFYGIPVSVIVFLAEHPEAPFSKSMLGPTVTVSSIICEVIRMSRIKRGLRVSQLADRMNIALPQVSHVEGGYRKVPTLETLRTFAVGLDVPLPALLKEAEDEALRRQSALAVTVMVAVSPSLAVPV